eukprot:Nk52_evm5s174 gene=Nk52_evmTU5s174
MGVGAIVAAFVAYRVYTCGQPCHITNKSKTPVDGTWEVTVETSSCLSYGGKLPQGTYQVTSMTEKEPVLDWYLPASVNGYLGKSLLYRPIELFLGLFRRQKDFPMFSLLGEVYQSAHDLQGERDPSAVFQAEGISSVFQISKESERIRVKLPGREEEEEEEGWGDTFDITGEEGGHLYFGVNDEKCSFGNNKGEYVVGIVHKS